MGYLRLEHIEKRFGGHEVLRDINLDIRREEFCVILGPSGCGKSTLLNIVAGLEEPTSGRLIIDGRDVTELPPHKRNIAMVFQNYALYPHLSVYENMAFGLRIKKMPEPDIEKKIKEVSRILDIEDKLEAFPRQLSGGQRQRVATGRAIVRDPSLFLFDEPLSNLDARLRLEVRKEFLKLQKRLKTTSLYVTHDQSEALALGDTVVVIKDAGIQQASSPQALFDEPRNLFVAGFIGSIPMNILAGRIKREGGEMKVAAGGFELAVPARFHGALESQTGSGVYFGIRPAAIKMGCGGYTGRVSLVETLGEQSLVYVRLGEACEIKIVVEGKAGVRPEEATALSFHEDSIYLFAEDGERIRPHGE